ncbi:MAG TPA: glycosyltransferase family 9 protein [Bacteroidia bacterium]|nr:glycosyltransferase family 9 protein [Bacteroidia bacterium]
MKQKKAIVFFSAGLGDALLLVPLVKRLKKQGYKVSGLFNSGMPCKELMENTGLLDEIISSENKMEQAVVSLKKAARYDLAVINYFAANRKNLLTAAVLAKQIFTNRKINPTLEKSFASKIKYVEPVKNLHDAEQNLLLIDERNFTLKDLEIPVLKNPDFKLPKEYVVLQISSGNAVVAYKDWPFKNWAEFLKLFFEKNPNKQIVLTGNKIDIENAAKLTKEFGEKIISLAGKTSITQAMQVLSNTKLFIGSDGGLMHLAVAFSKPTFTVWGPSSEKLYGYEQFSSSLHKCVRLNLGCFPCSAWINSNSTKAKEPESCPDHVCMKQLGANEVFMQFTKYVSSLPAHVW